MRLQSIILLAFINLVAVAACVISSHFMWVWVLLAPLGLLALHDLMQESHAVLRNYPLVGHFRFLLEMVRPEIQQYFIEKNTDENPFSRETRGIVYQRAKGIRDTVPFGTQRDLRRIGYEWINHSLAARLHTGEVPRIKIGGAACKQPYEAALLNISAMSFGSLSDNAIRALNLGAKEGGFYHNSGEGGISQYHRLGGDLVMQVGTAYFGCRDDQGKFDPALFKEKSGLDAVKMIELKISQGAKPGHGGVLPSAKITREISEIRNVPMGSDALSPPTHADLDTPEKLIGFLGRLRELSGAKPIGFKICIGSRRQFLGLCKAMLKTKITPDFITIDGAEGGTGAAPLEFSNSVGMPLREAIVFVDSTLRGCGIRKQIKIIAAGKIVTAFHLIRCLALGADLCNSARGMMFALGCIQALRCNTNECPVGVATQDRWLKKGLVVGDKAKRVVGFQRNTVAAAMELLGAAGLSHPEDLRPHHILRRVSETEVKNYSEIFGEIKDGDFLRGRLPQDLEHHWECARADNFEHPACKYTAG